MCSSGCIPVCPPPESSTSIIYSVLRNPEPDYTGRKKLIDLMGEEGDLRLKLQVVF